MASNRFKLIAFDMDGVLTDHPSSWRFIHEKLGVDNSANYASYRKGEINYHEFLDSDISLWLKEHPGITKDEIMEILRGLPIRKDLKRAIGLIRESGAKAVIISGGISWLADILQEVVEFDDSYSNVVNCDSSGVILPHGTVRVEPKRKGRVLKKIQDKFDILPEETASVGDSYYDSNMYRYSMKGVAFNSNSRELDEIADIRIESGKLTDLYSKLFLS